MIKSTSLVSSNGGTFGASLTKSFLIIFLSEIADKTFILILIFAAKMHWFPLVLTSLIAMGLMNILAIFVGYLFPLLLMREVLDWVGFTCFLLFGLYSLYEGFRMESKTVKEEYEEEMEEKEKENQYELVKKSDDNEIQSEKKESSGTLTLCFELFGLLVVSELGDKSEISTITIAAMYNVVGVLCGTMIAYLCTTLIATFLGHVCSSFLTERLMTILGGFVFLAFALEILIEKIF